MYKFEKTEDKLEIFNILFSGLLSNKVRFKDWMLIYQLFLGLILTDNLDIIKIKTYALVLINATVVCNYRDDEYELKNNKSKLKEFISHLDKKDTITNEYNKYNNIKEIYKEIFILEQDIKTKKRNI